jgi:CheY-like chemotaxis protein
METLGKLTGGVAHDFNNLLQVISGNLQLLSRDVARDVVSGAEGGVGGRIRDSERAQRWVDNALAGVERGAKLASQLLAFGRRQALAPKAIKIGRLISGMDDLLRRSLGEEIEIEMIVSGGLWSTFADPVQIENAILNLAINARDAMDGIGKLTIEVGNAYLDSQYAREHAEVSAGQYVLLAVTDTGAGMTKEVLAQVFEPFFSTKPEGKGTGLGLSMVYGFVKQSAGHVAIYSEPGQGTTVKVYLPRTHAEEDLAQPVTSLPVVGGAETILVAEDDADVRATVVELLTELGYRVLKATDAHSALAIIDSGIPVDLLFTDVVMPGPLRSPDLARKAKERLPNIAVLFTSGYTENAIVHGGRLDPGVELLGKPYTREALALKIRHVLNSRPTAPSVSLPSVEAAHPPTEPIPLSMLPATHVPGSSATSASAPASLAPSSLSVSPLSPERSSGEITMLLVEDDDLIRWNTGELLQEMGHRVVEAADGKTALGILATTAIDILITDVGLPDISGEVLATQARALQARIAVVFVTGSDHASAVRGATVLRKPYDGAHLAAALQVFLDGR